MIQLKTYSTDHIASDLSFSAFALNLTSLVQSGARHTLRSWGVGTGEGDISQGQWTMGCQHEGVEHLRQNMELNMWQQVVFWLSTRHGETISTQLA